MRCVIASLLLAAGTLLSGCTDRDADRALAVYRHQLDEAPRTLDPAHAATVYSNFIVVNAYDTLYSYRYLARPYELEPNLAAAMPEVGDDGLTYTIPLRKGVRFVDDPAFQDGMGREVTAHDVVYSLKRHFDPATRSRGRWLWQGRIQGLDEWHEAGADYDRPVEGLSAPDDYTLRVRLTNPYPQFVHTLAMGFAAVVPREAVEHHGSELAVRPVGSGPFRVTRFDSTMAVLEPKEDWRWQPVDVHGEGFSEYRHAELGLERIDGRTPPFVDRVEVHFVGDSAARWNAFAKGDELQFITLSDEQAGRVLSDTDPVTLSEEFAGRYRMRDYLESGFVYTGFNLDHEAIGNHDDPEREARNRALRCAIRKAFDWNARNEQFHFGLAEVFPGVIPPSLPEYDPDLDHDSVSADPKGARRLLAEHGWSEDNLPVLEYGYPGTVKERQIFEQFRGFLQDIGYPRDRIRARPFATFGDYSSALRRGEVMTFFLSWALDYPDAQNTLQLFYGPHGSPGANSTNYDNPDFNRLYERAATLQPSKERTGLYRRMNRMVIDDCVVISGLSRRRVMLWHDDVIAYPDNQMVGGFFLPYVALDDG